ncbi:MULTISPECIES: hypothetical protein [unclassified Moorena]|uniref:hypothetical protein n=1 Tax=unclassified Moorena TaxID=2683338 RepID=UPI0002EB2C32|nr:MULTISPECIES: hypothetical protein [unclassified Moorena]NEP36291.1 hypothetical protein [Moorena sp. SIO3B2]NER87042.1 hypothetical protein [Moorena sp. SIO3A2]NES45429.1 hypothetical protein [Moorena sp. SIO2C4]NET66894.1 hypothetical protein [Moorena sp. SIO1G6]
MNVSYQPSAISLCATHTLREQRSVISYQVSAYGIGPSVEACATLLEVLSAQG